MESKKAEERIKEVPAGSTLIDELSDEDFLEDDGHPIEAGLMKPGKAIPLPEIIQELEDLIEHLYTKYNDAPYTVGEAITRLHRVKNKLSGTY